jgi:hypothetical protein
VAPQTANTTNGSWWMVKILSALDQIRRAANEVANYYSMSFAARQGLVEAVL